MEIHAEEKPKQEKEELLYNPMAKPVTHKPPPTVKEQVRTSVDLQKSHRSTTSNKDLERVLPPVEESQFEYDNSMHMQHMQDKEF